jgi:UDP-3-O-acyl N-acetylglucosamine deacetylase
MTPMRRTIQRAVTLAGKGIHTGADCAIRFEPAPAGHGLVLANEAKGCRCPATVEFASPEKSDRRTVLISQEGVPFEQMEHVLAAASALGISDMLITQDGVEPPFMGGGSREYMEALTGAGFTELDAAWDPIVISEPLIFRDGDVLITATPADRLELSAFVEFPGTIVGSSGATVVMEGNEFFDEVSRARTFAQQRDVEMLQKAGLGKGGSLDNTVIFDESSFRNPSLNYPNEPARHKLLDLLGDLALFGAPIQGHFSAWRAGHRSHVRFVKFLQQELATRR